MSNQLVIINNEGVSFENNSYFCDNIEIKSLPEGLSKNAEVSMILRKSNIKRSNKINLNKITLSSNIFSFLLDIFKTFKKKETNYLLISITPYTFLAHILLFIFKKKVFVYLRSNGYEEYKAIFGNVGLLLYHIMFVLVKFRSNIIVCEKNIVRKNFFFLVNPSQLDIHWLTNTTKPLLDKPRLLYVGRIKVEKGIFSLIKILEKITYDFEFSILGKPNSSKIENNKKINYLGYENNADLLRKVYDKHNIFILPSFTEAHPQVMYESLARKRPIILFEEISHVIQNKQGVFVSQRNVESLTKTIHFIMDNYTNIQNSMKKNELPTKENFISQMRNIVN